MAFQPVEGSANFPAKEEAILKFWKERAVYEKSLAQRKGGPEFVFYEGPPTANGLPHPGHCLTRAIKDLFPRYRTMRGFHCTRKAGWDTHGLPVEVEVCKELGIHSKEEIEAYGVEPFIHKCQQSVWRYMREWERLTERLGFWVNLEEAYVTYHQSYVESVWWSLKQLFDRGLLYQGHKIVWWWAQGGTALSAGEVGQGYRQVADPSVYVKFPLLDDDGNVSDTSLLVWTTTPWTLPSNHFVAVNPEFDYSTVEDSATGESFIVASALVDTIAAKLRREFKTVETRKGTDLVERHYRPPFGHFWQQRQEGTWRFSAAAQRATVLLGLHFKHFKDLGAGATQEEAAAKVKKQQDAFLDTHKPSNGWQIVDADFVTTDSGTGIVHIAPAFGEDDMLILQRRRHLLSSELSLINAVAPNGKFTDEGPEYCRGRWVKDCDKDIIRDLKQRGLLFHQEQYVHDYPFCWRAEEDPLIQYPRESWFIRTTAFKDELIANNNAINWLPEHIKTGRMGKFLESNVDWALSRERYWGTPLPVWQCEGTGYQEAVGSYDELLAKPGLQGTESWKQAKTANPDLAVDLCVHKPYIDAVTYDSPKAKGARMRRVPDVIDCWYDSGAMPFAQWGFRGPEGPADAAQRFDEQFPADFISEALDQTRGWFYSQLAISTLLFGVRNAECGMRSEESSTLDSSIRNPHSALRIQPFPHPFKNCIVLGLMLGEDGQKMSKSKRNYREPKEIFDKYGADALRWYFFATQPPWTTIRYSEQAIKESIPEFLLRLWNVYSFFVIYANIDGFDPATELAGHELVGSWDGRRISATEISGVTEKTTFRRRIDRSELDRWIFSEMVRTVAGVVEHMDAYDNFSASQHIAEFIDAMSNWYVRRSRDRFWAADKDSVEKLDAYWTLYECLLVTTKLIAPFVPFIAEAMWQNLARVPFGQRVPESVHLCEYPSFERYLADDSLSARMNLAREISSLGRSARSAAKLKVRQPLAKVEVVLADTTHLAWLREHTRLIEEELNVKAVEFTTEGHQYITYTVVPNFKRLGPRLGKNMPLVKKLLAQRDGGELLSQLKSAGKIALELPGQDAVELDEEDIEIRLEAKEGWSAAQGRQCVVVLSTELNDELIQEGVAKDVVRAIQDQRKEIACAYTCRILVGIVSQSEELLAAVRAFRDYIQQETLADDIQFEPIDGVEPVTREAGGHEFELYVKVVT
jgi:isoleucyl-tRNA synthetase